MRADEEVREAAHLFGWAVNCYHDGDVLIRGDKYINVDYRKDGSVQFAEQRLFASLAGDHIVLQRTADIHKREDVISWLAE